MPLKCGSNWSGGAEADTQAYDPLAPSSWPIAMNLAQAIAVGKVLKAVQDSYDDEKCPATKRDDCPIKTGAYSIRINIHFKKIGGKSSVECSVEWRLWIRCTESGDPDKSPTFVDWDQLQEAHG